MINKIEIENEVVKDIIFEKRKSRVILETDRVIYLKDISEYNIYCVECNCKKTRKKLYKDILSKEFKCNSCRLSGSNNPFYGKKHSQIFKDRLSKERLNKWYRGEENGMYGKSLYDLWIERHGVDEANNKLIKFKTKISNSIKGSNNPFYGKTHTIESRNSISAGNKKYYEEHPEAKEVSRQRILKTLSSGKLYKKNFIETQVEEWLLHNNIDYVYSFILNKKFQYDFLLPNDQIIIEVQGDYWHANPRKYSISDLNERQIFKRNRDIEKKKFANDHNYDIIYIWEMDIRNGDFSVLEILKGIDNE